MTIPDHVTSRDNVTCNNRSLYTVGVLNGCSWYAARNLRGFVKLKKFQKFEKNSEVGGWVKPQLGFFFVEILCFLCVFFCVFSCFKMIKNKNKWIMGVWVGSD